MHSTSTDVAVVTGEELISVCDNVVLLAAGQWRWMWRLDDVVGRSSGDELLVQLDEALRRLCGRGMGRQLAQYRSGMMSSAFEVSCKGWGTTNGPQIIVLSSLFFSLN